MKKFNITVNGNAYEVEIEEVKAAAAPAPMPGKIVKLVASVGQAVNAGDTLLILEAMKMQNEIAAPCAGTVKSFSVNAGDSVKPGQAMVVVG